MARSSRSIYGITAPAARPTKRAATLLALICALPVGIILWIVEAFWL